MDEAPETPTTECGPGELTDGEGCIAPGIAPENCAAGFEPDGARGCVAVLPNLCAVGEMATPGETSCRQVAPCPRGRWGDIATDPQTQHVDVAYAGADSDGSAERPWTRVQDAIDRAALGATVAITDGVYVEDLRIAGKPLVLRGRCPAAVEVRGTSGPALDVRTGADGTLIADIAITSGDNGVWIDGAAVTLERVWIHDTAQPGLVAGNNYPTSVSIEDSLIERVAGVGVLVGGVELSLQRSVVRWVAPLGGMGLGVFALRSEPMLTPARLTVAGSLIEGHDNSGVVAICSQAHIEGSVIRDNHALGADIGGGIVASHCAEDIAGSLSVVGSIIERNDQIGVVSFGVDTQIDTTVIRDVWFVEPTGMGLLVMPDPYEDRLATVSLARSVVERTHTAGMSLQGGTLAVESVIVRDTQASPANGIGDGLLVRPGWTGGAASATLRGAIFQRNHTSGVLVFGADAHLEDVWIDETRTSSPFGGGMAVSYFPESLRPAQVSLVDTLITRSAGFGMVVLSSQASIARTRIADTGPSSDNRFGDGLVVVTGADVPEAPRASATLTRSRIENSARAGLANFGADIAYDGTTFSCNAIHINGESDFFSTEHHSYSFDDGGGNTCRCGEATAACSVVSSALDAPATSIDRPAVQP